MARTSHRTHSALLFFIVACLLIAPGFGPARVAVATGETHGPAALVKDLDTRPASQSWWGSVPSNLVSIGGTTYFSAQLDSTGFELWKTDGTANGTALIKDIIPGPESSAPSEFTNLNGIIYFNASSSSGTRQLWKTDGTSAGTTLFLDAETVSRINVNGTLFFLSGNALWKSDGTIVGTVMIKQLDAIKSSLLNINGALFFTASDGATGVELWKSDGTSAGTLIVKDIVPGPTSSDPMQLTNLNGTLFFLANDANNRTLLWKSDGTEAGTVLVDPTGTLPSPHEMINVNGTLFFSALRQLEFSQAWGIWKSDGTALGTTRIKDVDPGVFGTTSYQFTNVNSTLYFVGSDAATGGELWKSDGTTAGTVMVKDINPGAATSSPHELIMLNGEVFFDATEPISGPELWKSNGTEAGTVRVKDIATGHSSAYVTSIVNANGVLLFSADDMLHGSELWRSDGTEAGTTLVKDIDPDAGSAFSDNSPGFTDINGTLFFAADAGPTQRGLWKSDGTANGTTLIKDFTIDLSDDTLPMNLTNINGMLFFVVKGDATVRGLWKSDGTAAGTTRVKDIFPSIGYNPHIGWLTNNNGLLYFSAEDYPHGQELWKSDGTEAGTVIVKDINPGANSSGPTGMISLGGKLYFGAIDGIHGAELWQSDGTEAGTTLVKDINPGAADGFAHDLVQIINANGTLFMVATNADSGTELWRSDGAEAGTTLVKDINPGVGDALPSWEAGTIPITLLNGSLYFPADDGAHGRELWKTDGIAAGATLVKDIVPGAAASYPDWFAIANGKLLFSVDEYPFGNFDLWQSDGTEAGTSLVKASSPNGFKLMHGPITPVGDTGKALFSAYDELNGVELWQTDGTTTATQLLQNIAVGNIPSNPDHFTLVGERMFFLADDYGHGKELWSLPLSAIAPSGTAQITPEAGGSATFGDVTLSFPPGAVTMPITITYSDLVTPTQSLGGAHSAGISFLLEARDSAGRPVTQFAQPYTLVISYTDEELAALGVDEADLNLVFWNGSAWVNVLPCAGCGADTVNNRLTAVLDHFTEFALVGTGENRVYLPMVVR